ncbi:MAG: hypothetical protein RIQ89_1334 [Bacteroidota bacterium]|jgi:hemoglobin-like flavoprotein
MLTIDEIKLIKKSWKLLQGVDPLIIGDVFYRKLFIDVPEVRHLFISDPEEQARKLVDMLSIIIARLDELHILTDEIHKMAIRHVTYGVKIKHYEYVGSALLWTLEQGLRNEWNEQLAKAWTKCYNLLAQTMIKAAY